MVEKHYPTDPDGQLDAGMERETRWPKPCCRWIDHGNMLGLGLARTWCTQPAGHDGQCSGPVPREIAPSSYASLRLRGLRQDQFADRIAEQLGRTAGKEP